MRTVADNAGRSLVQDAGRKLARTVARFDRWFALCDALTAARGTEAAAAAVAAWEKGRVPSKASKYHAYDEARRIARILDIECPADIRGTRAEWRWAVNAAKGA